MITRCDLHKTETILCSISTSSCDCIDMMLSLRVDGVAAQIPEHQCNASSAGGMF